jgi:methylated-DNA-protein-cysteine methyltransferase-like protein
LDFYHSVYEIVKRIPEGRVTTYGAIAKALGSAQSSRMVGWAMNASHSLENVPAHRVVNRNGLLTGKMHFTPPERMQTLLETEGLTVINDQIVSFEKHFWDPFLEL